MGIVNSLKSKFRDLTNQNALANFADVNDAVNQALTKSVPLFNTIYTYSGNKVGNIVPVPRVSSIVNNVYITNIGDSVTNNLSAGKKLNIIDIVSQGFAFSVQEFKLIIGYNVGDWDGGDLQLYLGDYLIATVPAADLLNTTGILDGAKTIVVKTNNIIETASGTYSNVTGIVMTDTPTIFNLRLTSATIGWNGQITIITSVNNESNSCGIDRCEGPCSSTVFIYCGTNATLCANCPGSSFTGADTSPI